VPGTFNIGDSLEVFIYYDSEDRILATTEKPHAMVGDFAYLKVIAVNSFGAFLDWGLPKDLLVPFSEQKPRMKEGRSYVVKIYLDDRRHRIVASAKIDKFIGKKPGRFREGQAVDLLVVCRTDLGYKAIINGSHWGLLYTNEVFESIQPGQSVKGYIKRVRDKDKIDLTLQKPGYRKVDPVSHKILITLNSRGGFIPVTDKSPPEQIYELFGVSKKTYKKAVGALYKKRLIKIVNNGIKLNK
jgi:predicted RNA-binding protein (virulence factor B family)